MGNHKNKKLNHTGRAAIGLLPPTTPQLQAAWLWYYVLRNVFCFRPAWAMILFSKSNAKR